MDNQKKKNINRREFLKRLGTGTALASAAALTGCAPKTGRQEASQQPEGSMTYRTNPTTGDRVSLL